MNEEGYVYVEGYVNVARLRDTDARMIFVRRVMVNDEGCRVAQLQELGMLWSIGEFYGDELHDREQLRFEDRGGGELFVDRVYDGVTKVLCGRPEEGGVGLGVPCRFRRKPARFSGGTRMRESRTWLGGGCLLSEVGPSTTRHLYSSNARRLVWFAILFRNALFQLWSLG